MCRNKPKQVVLLIFLTVYASCGGEAEYESVQLSDMGCLPLAKHGDKRFKKKKKNEKGAIEIEQNCRPCRKLRDILNRSKDVTVKTIDVVMLYAYVIGPES